MQIWEILIATIDQDLEEILVEEILESAVLMDAVEKEKCLELFVINAEGNVRFHLNLQKEDLFTAVIVLKNKREDPRHLETPTAEVPEDQILREEKHQDHKTMSS